MGTHLTDSLPSDSPPTPPPALSNFPLPPPLSRPPVSTNSYITGCKWCADTAAQIDERYFWKWLHLGPTWKKTRTRGCLSSSVSICHTPSPPPFRTYSVIVLATGANLHNHLTWVQTDAHNCTSAIIQLNGKISHAGKQDCLCCEVFFLRTANYKQRRNVISGTFHTLLIWLLMMLWKQEKKKRQISRKQSSIF